MAVGPISRRAWFMAASASLLSIGAAGTIIDGVFVETNDLEVTRRRCGNGSRRVRVVHISDTHLKRIGTLEEHVAAITWAASPDLICFTGDIIEHANHVHLGEAFFALFDSSVPKYGVLGNWEHWARVDPRAFNQAYERQGGRLLVNESELLDTKDGLVRVVGLDDMRSGIPDYDLALKTTGVPARGVPAVIGTLLLQHCPLYRDTVDWVHTTRPDYMLSGHTHGGQIAPFGWTPVLPECTGRYVHGAFEDFPDTHPGMYVSRGIGTSTIPIRIGARPEVIIHDWYI